MKEHYHCFDISFPEVDFNSYWPNAKLCNQVQHAHLYPDIENDIELRIFFDPDTRFDRKFSAWASKISKKKFGTFVNTATANQNFRLTKIDFNDSSLTGLTISKAQYENEFEYILIKIDCIKLYWLPAIDNLNTGEFYLNAAGFQMVKDFYGIFFRWENEFKIDRMNGVDVFYPIEKAEFRPEYNFSYIESKGSETVTITKIPKLQFRYKANLSEAEAFHYAEIVMLLASFYYHNPIISVLSRIHLPEHTITFKKVQSNNGNNEVSSGLQIFGDFTSFHQFLQFSWQTNTISNFIKLSKVIHLFNQARIVDSSSEFLIRYNIIEICMGGGESANQKFEKVLNSEQIREKYTKALEILYQTIKFEDQAEFKKKWESVCLKLEFKPMKSPMNQFLITQRLNPLNFPISITKLKKLRDGLTHGSIKSVDNQILAQANQLLYKITGVLILNLIGVEEWKN